MQYVAFMKRCLALNHTNYYPKRLRFEIKSIVERYCKKSSTPLPLWNRGRGFKPIGRSGNTLRRSGWTTTAENELKQFVQDRNDAAHGVVDEVLSVTRIIEMSELVEALCVAIGEMLSWQVVSRKESNGAASTVGLITERFANGAVVAKMRNVEFQIGDRFYVCGASCCYPAVVKSIRLNGVDKDRMAVTTETEVGLMFDHEVKKSRKLYRVS
jgi:hypothetical protein